MTEIQDAAIHFEAKKISLKQSKDGTVITLVIHPADTGSVSELWETWTGQRYMVAMVGLTDEERPIATKTSEAGSRTVQSAGILCRDPDFQEYIGQQIDTFIPDDESCARELCKIIGVSSRAEMKENNEARESFLTLRDRFNRSRDEKN